MSEETAAKEALQAVYASMQRDYDDLEEAAIAAYQGAEGEGGQSGSSLVSRLGSLGDRVTERLKGPSTSASRRPSASSRHITSSTSNTWPRATSSRR